MSSSGLELIEIIHFIIIKNIAYRIYSLYNVLDINERNIKQNVIKICNFIVS